MAYGNWGAEVYCDKVPKHINCDTTVQQVLENNKQYQICLEHYLKNRIRSDITKDMCHAIVGDKDSTIIVLLYKSGIRGILSAKLERVDIPECEDWYDYGEIKLTVDDIPITLDSTEDPEGIVCQFTDKKDRQWYAKSAYCYGEGHNEWGD